MYFELDHSSLLFPHPSLADEDGLLAIGGDLSPDRLLTAYSYGIFPWYSEETPILWYAPHQRFVLRPDKVVISKSMKQIFKKEEFTFSINKVFSQVIEQCASINRKEQDGTWIVDDMQQAYQQLHKLGFSHSIEVWNKEELVGGLYGVLIGSVFCGESMFSKQSNSSKAGLIYLCQNFNLSLIDCQIYSSHLESLGAEYMEQKDFIDILAQQELVAHGLQETL